MNLRSAAAILTLAALGAQSALAVPTLTSLGNGTPLSVTNSLSGTYYIGGTGLAGTGAARWSLTGSTLTAASVADSMGGGELSTDDGAFITSLVINNPRWAIGNAAATVSPAYTPNPASLLASATLPPITAPGGARFNFGTSTHMNMGQLPIIPLTVNPVTANITSIACVGTAATVVTAAPHGLAVNDTAIISGNTQANFNGAFRVTAVDSPTQFQYLYLATCGAAGTGGQLRPIEIGTSGVYGTGSANGAAPDTSAFLTPNAISANGRFVVGLNYVCAFNAAGTSISATSFYWRPVLWDAQGNAGAGSLVVLPTPFRTGTGTGVNTRRRTGNPYAVSNDGLVVLGATEHNVGTTATADPDGGRLVVWRFNTGTSQWGMTYLDTGVDANGFPKGASTTPSGACMNSSGTIIVARAPDGITKWVWNGTTWGAPILLGNNLEAPASWLPAAVTSCGLPPNIGGVLAMSEDGSVVVGSATYSTCGSFMTQGFIWHQSDNTMKDWYDYNVGLGTPGCSTGGIWGPIGDNGNPARGQPVLGNPIGISPDGSVVVGRQGGNQIIVGAPPWIWHSAGGPTCVAPTVTSNPAATTNFSACSSSIILNVAASGTPPLSYQWYKGATLLTDGPSGFGSNITGANSFQFRITPPTGMTLAAQEAGTYSCVITGSCGSPVTSTNAVVQVDPAYLPATNDTCAGATTVSVGTNVLVTAQTPCGSYVNDPFSSSSCASNKVDLWYSFTPAATGQFRVETCGANFDTVLSIFDGCAGTEIGCNDNIDVNTGPTCGNNNRSRLSPVTLIGGNTYKIRVSANATAFLTAGFSTVNLSINPAPTLPANDVCSAAIPANVGINAYNTTEASPDSVAVLACAATANVSRDVWYTFNTPTGGKLSASTCPTGVASGGYTLLSNTVLALYDGPCGNVLSCNDNHTPVPSGCGANLSTINNYVMPMGQTVWIRVSANNATTHGQGQLNIGFQCPADLDNDGAFPGATPDGGVDISDLLYFLAAFEAGSTSADLDNDGDPAFATPDGGVDISDLLYFLIHFELGC
jgi:hypothetical protein